MAWTHRERRAQAPIERLLSTWIGLNQPVFLRPDPAKMRPVDTAPIPVGSADGLVHPKRTKVEAVELHTANLCIVDEGAFHASNGIE